MLRKTHIVTSEALYTGATIGLQPYVDHTSLITYGIGVVGIMIGAQLPDIDNPNTRIARSIGVFSKLFAPIKHRTYTHTIWAVALMFGLFLLMNQVPSPASIPSLSFHQYSITALGWFGFTLMLGYFFHLLEDSFSIQGIGWVYPFSHYQNNYQGVTFFHRKHWFYYRTGGGAEQVLLVIFSLIWIGGLYELIFK